jgi:hypothetical protein
VNRIGAALDLFQSIAPACAERRLNATRMYFTIRKPRPFRAHLIALITAVALLATACGSSDEDSSVTGEVIAVVTRSLTAFESLTVIDADRKVWEFTGGPFSGFTPSHLQEHMALGDSVKVWYIEDGDELTVTRIEDGERLGLATPTQN